MARGVQTHLHPSLEDVQVSARAWPPPSADTSPCLHQEGSILIRVIYGTKPETLMGIADFILSLHSPLPHMKLHTPQLVMVHAGSFLPSPLAKRLRGAAQKLCRSHSPP